MNFKAPKLGKTILLLVGGMAFGLLVPLILIVIINIFGINSDSISKIALLLGEA